MKLCFSTLGCPGWSWQDIIVAAKDIGMDGVEVRCIGNQLYAPMCPEFRQENIPSTLSTLERMGLSIPCLDSNATIAISMVTLEAMHEAKDYIDLAARIGTKFVRVMCVGVPEPVDCSFDTCLENYTALCSYAKDKGVIPLLETNGEFADSKTIMKLMDKVPYDNKGILWDVHHPFRFYGETPAYTYSVIKPLLRHIHIKDSVVIDKKIVYRMMGKGDVPVKEAMLLLLENGYDGFVSLEWVKKWQPDLEDAGVVFPNFANYAHKVIASFGK